MKFFLGFLVGVVFVPVVAAIAGSLGLLPVAATASPPAWESRLAHRAVRASLAREAIELASPVPATEENLRVGMRLYRMNCSGCHGDYGSPSGWGTTSFYPRVPQFAEEPSRLTTPEMFLVARHGIRYSGMAAWCGLMPDDDIWRVVSFVSHIRNLPPSVDSIWKRKRPAEGGGS